MISDIDASRMSAIGMDEEKINVLGNAKYDALAAMAAPALQDDIARRFNVRSDENFWLRAARIRAKKKWSLGCIRN